MYGSSQEFFWVPLSPLNQHRSHGGEGLLAYSRIFFMGSGAVVVKLVNMLSAYLGVGEYRVRGGEGNPRSRPASTGQWRAVEQVKGSWLGSSSSRELSRRCFPLRFITL